MSEIVVFIRKCYSNTDSKKKVFENVNIDDLLSFLREMKL